MTAPAVTEGPWTRDALGKPSLAFAVVGDPAPQGSKTAGTTKAGRPYVREASKKLKPWREQVTAAALRAVAEHGVGWRPLGDKRRGVVVDLVFTMPRPLSLPKHTRFRPATRPDLDKLTRSVLDSLTYGSVLSDDGVVVAFRRLEAVYAGDPDPDALQDGNTGVVVRVWAL